MTEELTLVLPQNQALVDQDVITVWHAWMVETAEAEIKRRIEEDGAVFDNEGQRRFERGRLVLEYCGALDTVVDGVRTEELTRIAREQLFRYAAEGWTSLREAMQAVGPSYASKGMRSQLATLAGDVAPWCEEQGVEVFDQPGKMWNLSEGASALRSIIAGPGTVTQKRERVEEELDYLKTHSRGEIRARYRQYRGEPGVGTVAELPTGEVILMIVAPPDVAEAAKQRVGNLVASWAPTQRARRREGKMKLSKVDQAQIAQPLTYLIVQQRTRIIDAETGEIVEVLG